MVELIKDETTVEVKGGKAVVTRLMMESFDPQEYLQTVQKLDAQIEHLLKQSEEIKKQNAAYSVAKEEMQKIRDAEIAEADRVRAEAVKRDREAKNENLNQ